MNYVIYTDGACSGNPGPGGWAFFAMAEGFPPDQGHEQAGAVVETTSNRMELQAAIEALRWIRENGHEPAHDLITIRTDSTYLRDGVTEWLAKWKQNGWRTGKGAVKNQQLWEELDGLLRWDAARMLNLRWEWVEGHSGDEFNRKVDKLAVKAYKALKKEQASRCYMVRIPQKGTKRLTALVDMDGILRLFDTYADAEVEAERRGGEVMEVEKNVV